MGPVLVLLVIALILIVLTYVAYRNGSKKVPVTFHLPEGHGYQVGDILQRPEGRRYKVILVTENTVTCHEEFLW